MNTRGMGHYRVAWEIDVEASSPQEAAWEALAIQRDRTSTATVFDVQFVTYGGVRGRIITVDLEKEDVA